MSSLVDSLIIKIRKSRPVIHNLLNMEDITTNIALPHTSSQELKGYLDTFESNLIKIGLISNKISRKEDSIRLQNFSHDFDPEIESANKKKHEKHSSWKSIILLIICFLNAIKHSLTIGLYIKRQDNKMTMTMKIFSSRHMYNCFGDIFAMLFSASYFIACLFVLFMP